MRRTPSQPNLGEKIVTPSNPHLSGPMDEICDVFATHNVAGALHGAIETWQSWLDGATFSID